MKKELIPVGMAILALIFIPIIIIYEVSSYTPIDKDESKVVQEIDAAKLNASAKFWHWKKQTAKEITNQEVLKRGVLKVFNLEKTRFDKQSRQAICAITYCESETNDVHGRLAGAKADIFDFNDDKKNEIIGYSYAYCRNRECELHILERELGEFRDISWAGTVDIDSPITVLNHKTGGYHDLVIFTSKAPNVPVLRRYGLDLSEYDDTINVTKEEWLNFIKK